MNFEQVRKIIAAILKSITFLGPDDAKMRLGYFFDNWSEQDNEFFESFKAVYVKSELLQKLFDEKEIDFPVS